MLHLNIHIQIQLPVNAWERFSINPRKSRVLWPSVAVQSISGKTDGEEYQTYIARVRGIHAWLSSRNTATGPRPPLLRGRLSVPVMYACMYLSIYENVHACLHLYMYLRDSCDVWVPCVQPAGTVWGLFFSGPAENWGKAGRMGLPRRPWRVYRRFHRLHNQDNLPKTCWSSQWTLEINKCAM